MRADGRQRIVAGAPATLTWQPVGSDGEPADPGTVTVDVVRADGTVLKAPLTATTGSGSNPRAVALSVAETANLDWLTATWTVSGTVVAETVHEIVGGVYMTTAAIRAQQASLADEVRHPTAALIEARNETERMLERELHRACVPRFRVATVHPSGMLPETDIRAVRWVVDEDGNDVTYTHVDGSRRVEVAHGRTRPVYVGFEYGLDAPPSDILRKFSLLVRRALNEAGSTVDARALSVTTPNGETQRFPTPGLGPFITGIPDVDQAIIAHRWTRVMAL